MNAPAKFLFDVDFAEGAKAKAPAEPTITLGEHQAQLTQAEAAGYSRGFHAAQAEAQADTQRRLAAAFEQAAARLQALQASLQAVEARLETEAVDVAVAVGRKLAAELIAREPFAEMAALTTECFRHLVGAPHVVVRVSDAVYPVAREKLDEIAKARGFEGRLVVLAEPEIAVGDCRVEWADGGVTRDRAAIEKSVADLVGRHIAARRAAAPDLSGESLP
jgi:flagellar assembly protein FliH